MGTVVIFEWLGRQEGRAVVFLDGGFWNEGMVYS